MCVSFWPSWSHDQGHLNFSVLDLIMVSHGIHLDRPSSFIMFESVDEWTEDKGLPCYKLPLCAFGSGELKSSLFFLHSLLSQHC